MVSYNLEDCDLNYGFFFFEVLLNIQAFTEYVVYSNLHDSILWGPKLTCNTFA
jgi:hypothetical protein